MKHKTLPEIYNFNSISLKMFFFLTLIIFPLPCIAGRLFLSTVGNSPDSAEIKGISLTNDGKLIMVGGFTDTTGNLDALVIKSDISGNLMWVKTYGGDSADIFTDIKQTTDNGFITVGWTKSFGANSYDFWVVKMDSIGNIQWEKCYGGDSVDKAWSVDIDSNYYFVVGGTNSSFGSGFTDVWAIKLDQNGNIVWQKTYGWYNSDDAPEYVARGIVDQSGHYLISSTFMDRYHAITDIWVARLNASDGSEIWMSSYGRAEPEVGGLITELVNGNYLIAGTRETYTNEVRLLSICIDTSGNIIWDKVFDIPGIWTHATDVTSTLDGGALLAGYYYEQNSSKWFPFLIKIDSNGNPSFAKQYHINSDFINSTILLSNKTIAFAGSTIDTLTGNREILMARTDSTGDISNCPHITPLSFNVHPDTLFPAPLGLGIISTPVIPQPTSSTVSTLSLPVDILCFQVSVAEQYYEGRKYISVYIYPNSKTITFHIKNILNKPLVLSIYNVSGRLVETQNIIKNKIIFKINDFAKGTYFYKIWSKNDGKTIEEGKFIVP